MSQRRHMIELIEVVHLLTVYFKDDYKKIYLWLNTPNLNLGGTDPMNLIIRGRGLTLIRFIKTSLDEGGMLGQTE